MKSDLFHEMINTSKYTCNKNNSHNSKFKKEQNDNVYMFIH